MAFNESAGAGFIEITSQEWYKNVYNSGTGVLDWTTLPQIRAIISDIENSSPGYWTAIHKSAKHVGPRTSLYSPDPTLSQAKLSDSEFWDSFQSHKFYMLSLTMSRGVPKDAVIGKNFRRLKYSWTTAGPVLRSILEMLRGGWSGTRHELSITNEMKTLFDSLPYRSSMGHFSLLNIINEVVGYCIARGQVVEGRRGKEKVLLPGPNINADRIYTSRDFITFNVSVHFMQDDWIFFSISPSGNVVTSLSGIRVKGMICKCDGRRGVQGAVAEFIRRNPG
jgi:hypothetical protein